MIEVRPLGPDDLAQVLKLCREFFIEYQDHHPDFFDTEELRDADISGRFIDSMESDNSATLVAMVEDRIIGYALLSIRDQAPLYKIKRVGSISGLIVTKEHRRKGVAQRLLDEAKAFFNRAGVRYFTVFTALANQGAIAFYKENGLSPLHTTFIGETDGD